MRARSLVLALCLLAPGLAAAQTEVALATPTSPAAAPRAVIALDAGHGGRRIGAVGPDGLLEKDVTRAVVARLAEDLRARGYEVVLVRQGDDDVDLHERVRRANDAGADVFVSIHCNAVAGRRTRRHVRGIETYFLSADATDEAARRLAEAENDGADAAGGGASDDPLAAILLDLAVSAAHEDSSLLAADVQQSLVKTTGWPDRGVRQAPFAVLNGAAMPAVLVEVGFLTHPTEGRRLGQAKVQKRLAQAVGVAVQAFLGTVAKREAGHRRVAGR